MSDPREHETDAIGAAIREAAARATAPDSLRAVVAARRAASARPRRRRWGALAGAITVTAAAVLALVLALPGGGAHGPSVADAAGLAVRAPVQPAPAVDPGDPRYVQRNVDDIRFPNYDYRSSWRAIGARDDMTGGRRATTVTYGHGADRIGYAIVSGDALPVPSGARRVSVDGTPVALLRTGDGALVATWERDGHTCVLASRTATEGQLLAFVAWQA